jgi:hypothetical protein
VRVHSGASLEVLLDRKADGGSQLHNANLMLREPIQDPSRDRSLNINVMNVRDGSLTRRLTLITSIQQEA